jgi:hypothetical protein
MVTITDTNIRHTVYESVYDIINSTKSSYGTPTLYGGMPDINDITFPAIVIMPVEVSEGDPLFSSVNSTSKSILITVMCFSKSNKGADLLADGVTHALRSSIIPGITLISVSDDNSFISPNEQKLKVKTLGLTYYRR